jgi:NADH-quinone oxidoreductase subunit N
VIGAFYYLRIVKLMYFDAATDQSPLMAGRDFRVVLSLNGLAVLALGIFPQVLIGLAVRALG